jgi:hypothetical protein
MPFGGTYSVMPARNTDWMNGVSTLDLIQVQKHLLGIKPLTSPYKMIAADANKSNSISAIDIVTLRRLILGIIHEIPENTSWRFVDSNYDFIDPANPLNEVFAESFEIAPFAATMADVDFIGIKVGDVNNTVVANLNNVIVRSNPGAITLQTDDRKLVRGQIVEVAIQAGEDISLEGYQFTLDFDPAVVAFESFVAGELQVNIENFNTREAANGLIATSWSDAQPHHLTKGDVLFTVQFKALTDGVLSNVLSVNSDVLTAEAYDAEGQVLDVALKFTSQQPGVAAEFELLENRPNPFSEATMINFVTPAASIATITIYDVTGQMVDQRHVNAQVGLNSVEITGLRATGVLYCQVSTDEFSATRKMIRLE